MPLRPHLHSGVAAQWLLLPGSLSGTCLGSSTRAGPGVPRARWASNWLLALLGGDSAAQQPRAGKERPLRLPSQRPGHPYEGLLVSCWLLCRQPQPRALRRATGARQGSPARRGGPAWPQVGRGQCPVHWLQRVLTAPGQTNQQPGSTEQGTEQALAFQPG